MIALILLAIVVRRAPAQSLPTLTVKMVDAVDSDHGTEGQQFRATVIRPLQMGSTVIPVGSPAMVVLARGTGGSAWTLKLVSMTVGGQTYKIVGQNPQVVPVSVTDVVMISKGAVSTPRRIAVAAGLSVRFTLNPLPPANPAQNAPPPSTNPGAAQAPAPARETVPPPQTAPAPEMSNTPAIPTRGNLAPEPGVRIGDPSSVLEDQGFRVRLVGCSKQGGDSVTCDYRVTNLGEDGRRISLGAGDGYGAVDAKGQTITLRVASLANSASPWVEAANGIAMPARIVLSGVDPDVNGLFRVPLSIRVFPAEMVYFEWRNVSLQGAPASAPLSRTASTPPPPPPGTSATTGAEVSVEDYNFSALRCNSLSSTIPGLNDSIYPSSMDYSGFLHLDPTHPLIECFFRVENLKASREIILDSISLIGNDGNTYDSKSRLYSKPWSHLGWIGNEGDYRKSATIPYCTGNGQVCSQAVAPPEKFMTLSTKYPRTPSIKPGAPEYFWAAFVGPDTKVTEASQIRLAMRTSRSNGAAGYHQISATFRNVPIVPFSKSTLNELSNRNDPKPTPSSVTAEVAIAKYWSRVVSKCNGSWFTRGISDPYHSRPKDNPLYKETEYRDVRFSPVRQVPLPETDRMNGVEWKATAMMLASATRDRIQNEDHTWGAWGEWGPILPLSNPTVLVQKKKGFVTYEFNQSIPYDQLNALVLDGPSCADVR